MHESVSILILESMSKGKNEKKGREQKEKIEITILNFIFPKERL